MLGLGAIAPALLDLDDEATRITHYDRASVPPASFVHVGLAVSREHRQAEPPDAEEQAPKGAEVIDLMSLLKKSVEGGRKADKAPKPRRAARKRRAA